MAVSETTPPRDHIVSLGFSGVIRLRGNTQVHLRLEYEGELVIKGLIPSSGQVLALKGRADNLAKEVQAKLIWLLRREGSDAIEEIPHHVPVVIIPSDTNATPLKDKPFRLEELHEVQAPPNQPPPTERKVERRPLGWDVEKTGLYGRGAIGFRLEPTLPFVDAVPLLPGASRVSLAIPLEVRILAGGRPIEETAASLRVGSTVTFLIDSRPRDGEQNLFRNEAVGLRVWESEYDCSSATAPPGHAAGWPLRGEEHTESVQLGVGPGGLWYSLDFSEAPLRFRFELLRMGPTGEPVKGWAPIRRGQVAEVPAPTLVSWSLEKTTAEDTGSHGPPLFRAVGKVENFEAGYMPPLAVSLRSYRLGDERNPDVQIEELSPAVTTAGVPAAASGTSAAQPSADTGDDSSNGTTTAHADPRPRLGTPPHVEFWQDFVLNEAALAAMQAQERPTSLFATVRIALPQNAGHPFAQLIRYAANMLGNSEDNLGFAPFAGERLALRETGTEVCTDLLDASGQSIELESEAIPKEAPPPWIGNPWTPLTWQECMMDFAPWEGFIPWMYRDSRKEGFITVGIGVLIGNDPKGLAKAREMPFRNKLTNDRAKAEEIEDAWKAALRKPPARPAKEYEDPKIALPSFEVIKLFRQHLEEYYLYPTVGGKRGEVYNLFPAFDTYPRPARRGIIDMIYAHGKAGLQMYVNLMAAIKRPQPDWLRAAKEAVVKEGQVKRNQWRRALFTRAAELDRERAAGATNAAVGPTAPRGD